MLGTKSITQGEERKQWITQKTQRQQWLKDLLGCIFDWWKHLHFPGKQDKTNQNPQTNKTEKWNEQTNQKPQNSTQKPQTNRKTPPQKTKSIFHKENWVFRLHQNNKGFSLLWRMKLDGTKSRVLWGGVDILHSLTLCFSPLPTASRFQSFPWAT